MKILWISNIIFPEACRLLNIIPTVVGGWMQSGAEALLNLHPEIQLGVVSFCEGKKLRIVRGERIVYYIVPSQRNKQSFFIQIKNLFQPDVTHIHGSEYPHSLEYIKSCGSGKAIVSIQGLVSVYAKYYLGGIPERILRQNITLRDRLRNDSLFQQQRNMEKRGILEVELIKHVGHIIGRTSWDRSCVWSINPNANYHFCNETLRDVFYEKQWTYKDCHKHTIFVSQGHYPIKGVHKLLEALPIICLHYPDVQVRIAGNDFLNVPGYRMNGYANYLNSLIKKYNLSRNIMFLGVLSAEKMVDEYQKANVFICPSSIENSPNSVGEAQLVGTPVVASYVGGSMDMVENNKTGLLYRFEETPLLAMHVCNLFASSELCEQLSSNARIIAHSRHDKNNNAKTLFNIYQKVLSESIN